MAGATSLVELILKKWGDDIAGAAKELEEKIGFPESVANRIATGELPMDAESVARRADEQGYGEELYHGSTHDIKEFDGLLTNTENDMGQGTYLTDSIFDVSNNYAGEGPDLTNRIQSTAERIEGDLQSNWSHASDFWDQLPGGGSGKLADDINALAEEGNYEEAAMMAAKAINKGPTGGAIYPVRVKGDGVVSSRDRIETRDYHSEAADDLGYDSSDLTDDQMDEVSELASELEADDWQSVEHSARSVASGYGADDVYIEPDSTWSEVRDSLGSGEMYNDDGMPVGSGQALAEVLQGEGVKGYRDLESPGRFAGMAAGKHTIMFPGSENQIRSVNAAFDPQYTGSNIMGGAALPVAAGLLAAGQSEDADAGFVTKGGKTLLEAFHGSPHKFDKFSMDQIGTGEGAQAYGHGLYFADSEQVARQYRDELSRTVNYDGKPLVQGNRPNSSLTTTGDEAADDHIIAAQGDIDAAIMQLEYDLKNYAPEDPNIPYDQDTLKKLKQIKEDGLITIDDSAGALYRTEIDVTPESLLDYDTPLQSQPQAVQDAFVNAYRSHMNDGTPDGLLVSELLEGASPQDALNLFDNSKGSQSYRTLADMVGGEDRASVLLNEQGVRGIKFADGNSRKAKQAMIDGKSDGFVGDENYVIFDDSLINIAERGNADPRLLAGTAAGTAGLLAAPMVKDSGMISSPRSETLFDLTMGARDVERRLEGSLGSLLFPSGLVDYLETVNRREEDPNAMTRGMALLDVLPW